MATTSGTAGTGSSGTTGSGAENSGRFWSSSRFPWIVMAVVLIAILIAGGIYFWVTKIQPVIPGLLEFITQPL